MLIISRMLISLRMLACSILSGGEILWNITLHWQLSGLAERLASSCFCGERYCECELWEFVDHLLYIPIAPWAGHHSLVADSWIGCDGRGIKQKGSAETCSWWCSSSCFHSYPCCACNRFWSYSTPEQQERLWQTVPCSYISWSPLLMKHIQYMV